MRLAALAAVVVALIVGCGGGSNSGSAAAYTEGFCASLEKWFDSTRGDGLQEEMSAALRTGDLEEAKGVYVGFMESTRDAAVVLRDELQALGTPTFDDGAEIAAMMNDVADELVMYWTDAAGNGEGFIITTDEQRFVQSMEEFVTTLDDQEHLKPIFEAASRGEFKEAYEESDYCQEFSRRADQIING